MKATDFKWKDNRCFFVFGESKKELCDKYGVYVQEVEYQFDGVTYLKYSVPNKTMYGVFVVHDEELADVLMLLCKRF